MHILVAPTAFKGSLSPTQAADAITAGLRRSGLGATFDSLPLADGGDGTLESFLATGGRKIEVGTVDALMRPIRAPNALFDDRTAVVEMALASGLALIPPHERNALRASSFGTGILMQAALDTGATRIIVGLGGSATTDGGAGALAALGVRLLDANGEVVEANGGSLAQVAHFDVSALDPRWRTTDLVIATDVQNPALGGQGAAHVFAPQKGASPEQVEALDANLSHFFAQVAQQTGINVRDQPGGGAAGALAAGLLAFLGGRIASGVDLILDHHRIDARLETADLVITGEGKLDTQTIGGKAPLGIARRAAAKGVRTIALVGGFEGDAQAAHEQGFWSVLPITPRPMNIEDAMANAAHLLEDAALRLGYLLRL
jgi:glycerate 2-kinase